MSDLAMSVIIGPAHPNTGMPGTVDLIANLFIGGAGMWTFTPLNPSSGLQALTLPSKRNLALEIQAGTALSLGLGTARELAALGESTGISGSERIDTTSEVLGQIAQQGRNRGVALWVASPNDELLRDVAPLLAEEGWSVTILATTDQRLQTQWD